MVSHPMHTVKCKNVTWNTIRKSLASQYEEIIRLSVLEHKGRGIFPTFPRMIKE